MSNVTSVNTRRKLIEENRSWLPKFFIAGAMKSGTSSLQAHLNAHPGIFIPSPETHFFSIDDINENPDFFLRAQGEWPEWDFEEHFESYLRWYRTFFERSQEDSLNGECCVSYLPSQSAAQRIANLLPDAKFVFILRNPVDRAYSHYWHLVRTHRLYHQFDDALQFSPSQLLKRSDYASQLGTYYRLFPAQNIKVVAFEEYLQNPAGVFSSICDFLGVEGNSDSEQFASQKYHLNTNRYPRFLSLMLFANFLLRKKIAGGKNLAHHLPGADTGKVPAIFRWFNRQFSHIPGSDPFNQSSHERLFLTKTKGPKMKKETRIFLENLFYKNNQLLTEMLGYDIARFWPSKF